MKEQESEKQFTLEELEVKLNTKQKLFCKHYITRWNGADSARKAGYSPKTAKEMAWELLTKPHIKQYIEYIKGDFEKQAGISKLSQLNELKKIAYSSIAEYHDSWISLKQFESLSDEQKAAIESIEYKYPVKKSVSANENEEVTEEENAGVEVKIKLFDKQRAIDLINKMLGYNEPEKREVTTNESTVIILPDNGR